MTNCITSLKMGITRLIIAVLVLPVVIGMAQAFTITIGDIDMGGFATTAPTLTSADLYKWRQTSFAAPVSATAMTFAYLSGTGLALPSRSNPKDFSANDQNDMWSDNAVKVVYNKGNSAASQILISATDKSGGLISTDGTSTLPLLWKAVSTDDLTAASTATVSGSFTLVNGVRMPKEVVFGAADKSCPVGDGPYGKAGDPPRGNNGFCDYATHYMIGETTTNPAWYNNMPTGTARTDAFNYAALVGPNGPRVNEDPAVPSSITPVYALLGANFSNAQATHYHGGVNVELLNL